MTSYYSYHKTVGADSPLQRTASVFKPLGGGSNYEQGNKNNIKVSILARNIHSTVSSSIARQSSSHACEILESEYRVFCLDGNCICLWNNSNRLRGFNVPSSVHPVRVLMAVGFYPLDRPTAHYYTFQGEEDNSNSKIKSANLEQGRKPLTPLNKMELNQHGN